jgi:hypothetical protein
MWWQKIAGGLSRVYEAQRMKFLERHSYSTMSLSRLCTSLRIEKLSISKVSLPW